MPHKTATQPKIQHDQEQLGIALHASYEAESILRHMLRNASDDLDHAWVKSFVLRLNDLNGVCMSALCGPDAGETEEMRKVLEGV